MDLLKDFKMNDPKQLIEQMRKRIIELEGKIENLKKDQMRNNIQYHKHLKIKHASRAIECANKIVGVEKKIEKYKQLIIKEQGKIDV
jgi:hypothetical protein